MMCSMDLQCYTIATDTGYFETYAQCKQAIKELITGEDFQTTYMIENGEYVYYVYGERCINWNDVDV